MKKVRVWDSPTRCFHWLLATCVVGLFTTGLIGGNWIVWHERIGFVVLTLVLFRIVWGFIGSETSRFTDFVRGPGAVIHYLKSGASPTLGHSPVGALAVLAMLAALLLQATTGLMVDDDIANKGPLADKVPSAWVALATKIHRINKWVIAGLVVMHLCAIVFYTRVKKDPLVQAMLSGDKEVQDAQMAPRMRSVSLAWPIFGLAAAFVYWLVIVYPR
jgi:cytochrome b